MSARLEAALAELAAAIREEVAAAAVAPGGPPELLSIDQAAKALNIGRSRLYGEIGAGRVRSIRIGRRRLIPADALAAYAVSDGA